MPILLILSLICFGLATLGVNAGNRVSLLALGLVFLVANMLWPRAGVL